ncbi:MAG: NUMOD1 domain-containing DNA-binding protein [Magnetococcus sp. YQC-3]
MFIYCIGNTANNKKYIGKTINKVEYRFTKHKSDAEKDSPNYFHKAIRKHGEDKFYIEWIKDYTGLVTESELLEIEMDMIFKYDSFNNGYNSTLGGEGIFGINEKPIIQWDLTGKFLNNFNSIREASKKLKLNESHIAACCRKDRNFTGGYLFSFKGETPNKYIPKSNKVYQWDLDGNLINIFNSIIDASRKTGICKVSIGDCCRNKTKVTHSYMFSFDNQKSKYVNSQLKKVYQLDLNGNLIKEFNSMTEASLEVGVEISNISYCCKGVRKTTGGFRWSFSNIV